MSVTGTRDDFEVGVLKALVDFEFTRYATPRLVRILYILTFVLIALGGLFFFISALFSGEPLFIVFSLILTPLVMLVYLVYARVGLELLSIVFRIGDDVHQMRAGTASSPGGPGTGRPPAPGGSAPAWGGPQGPPPSGPPAGGPPPSGPPAGGPPPAGGHPQA